MQRSAVLEIARHDLHRQLHQVESDCDLLQAEFDRSRNRLHEHQLAEQNVESKAKELADAQNEKKQRTTPSGDLREADLTRENARVDVEKTSQLLQAAELSLQQLRRQILDYENASRDKRRRLDDVNSQREAFAIKERIRAAHDTLDRAAQSVLGTGRFEEAGTRAARPGYRNFREA